MHSPSLWIIRFFVKIQLSPLYSACKVYSHKLPPWKKETDRCYPFWLHVSGVLLSKMFTAAPCDSFLRVGKWQSRAEYALIALLFSPSQRLQLRREKMTSHYSWMPAISRWSGWGDSVFVDMSQPENSICFYIHLWQNSRLMWNAFWVDKSYSKILNILF